MPSGYKGEEGFKGERKLCLGDFATGEGG